MTISLHRPPTPTAPAPVALRTTGTIRVAIADVHPLIRYGVRLTIEHEPGLRVSGEAESLDHLLALLDGTPSDVALLDAWMPGGGGAASVERVRAAHPEVAVVVFSEFADQEKIRLAFERGADAYVVKGIRSCDLGSVLRQAVDGTFYCARGIPVVGSADLARGDGLSDGEISVLRGVARGASNREIAAELWLSEQTVKFHLKNIYRKLGLANRTQASRYAYERGFASAG